MIQEVIHIAYWLENSGFMAAESVQNLEDLKDEFDETYLEFLSQARELSSSDYEDPALFKERLMDLKMTTQSLRNDIQDLEDALMDSIVRGGHQKLIADTEYEEEGGEPLTIELLKSMANRALGAALPFASSQIDYQLPAEFLHEQGLEDSRRVTKNLEEALSPLEQDGRFFPSVTLVVRGIHEGRTVVSWLPSGCHSARTLKQTHNEGFGPFKVHGFVFPEKDRLCA